MDVRFISDGTVERHEVGELRDLLARDDGMVWVDVPSCDSEAADVLSDVFGFHPLAVRACVERNRVPKVHGYGDHVFVVLHGPKRGHRGHMHYIELDLFIGPNYLVTVHGPVNPAVHPDVPLRETHAVLERIPTGGRPFVDDLVEQFDRVSSIADGQKDDVEGVIEYHRTRTETKMMVATERLAVIAVVTLPITALASIYGMNLIVNERTDFAQLVAVLLVMVGMSTALLVWAKRKGWW